LRTGDECAEELARLFDGQHYDREIILLCLRWYLSYKLGLLDRAGMMAARGLSLSHTTIPRGAHPYPPEFIECWNRFGTPAGLSWRVDETSLEIRGKWVYLYRAVDRAGQTGGFVLRANRDVATAKAFFKKAVKHQGCSPKPSRSMATLPGIGPCVCSRPIASDGAHLDCRRSAGKWPSGPRWSAHGNSCPATRSSAWSVAPVRSSCRFRRYRR
jgi:hypothetical protein